MQRRTVIAGALGIVGVALLVLRSNIGLDAVGVTAGVVGTASMATGVVLTKRWGRDMPLLAATGWQLVAGGMVLAPLMLALEGMPPALTATNLAGHLWLATAGTAGAYVLWFRGVEGLPVQRVSLLGLLSPLVATTVGLLVLDQSLAAGQVAGALLVLVALRVGQGRLRPSASAPPHPARHAVGRPVLTTNTSNADGDGTERHAGHRLVHARTHGCIPSCHGSRSRVPEHVLGDPGGGTAQRVTVTRM